MSLPSEINSAMMGGGGYQISRSVRLRSSASAYLNRTSGTPTSQNIYTISFWVKRGKLGASQEILGAGTVATDAGRMDMVFNSDDTISIAGGLTVFRKTNALFRDPSAWYHIVLSVSLSGTVNLYVNNVAQTFATSNTWTTSAWNAASTVHRFGYDGSSSFFDGYLTEINFIDGQALTPSSFGQTNSVTGVWQPIKYAGTYGTNGFYLNFSDNSNNTATTIGKDYSGNGNNWTPNNISITAGVTYDSMLDTPTPFVDGGNGRGNYCTLNPLYKGTSVNPTEGNLKFTMTSGNLHEGITGTIFPTSGKWYAEFLWNTVTAATSATAVCRNNAAMNTITCAFQNTVDTNSPTYRSYIVNGNKDTNTTSAAYGNTYTATDIIGVALDLDNNKVWFSKNGTWQASGDPAAGTNAAFTDITGSDGWTFGVSGYGTGGDNCNANFGQRPFTYTPPSGFVALNTQNLPKPTISNGANYMAATTYTGTGATQSITNTVNGISFQPDWVWVKGRSGTTSHNLSDSVRGTASTLFSNTTGVENTSTSRINAFNSNGFSVGNDTDVSTNAATYIAWQWKAGGAAVTNTAGSINSQVSANPTAGFSIVTYTGNGSTGETTVGHGLGVAPSMVIIKNRSSSTDWPVYHRSLPSFDGGNYPANSLRLNTTGALASTLGLWVAPNSTTITIGDGQLSAGNRPLVNTSGSNYVAYCFAAVAGYSAFGSYTGNGSTDGPFVYLGFRPRYVMLKCTNTAATNWFVHDTSRATYNLDQLSLLPNDTSVELNNSAYALDVLSNGFKIRTADGQSNANASTYIYAAFAENPFKNSLAR
jgi:hypothetical protein